MSKGPDEGDILLSIASEEIVLATKIREGAQGKDGYYIEQASAALAAFHEAELSMLKHYIDIKRHHPAVATALEEHKPYLRTLWDHATEIKASLSKRTPPSL